MSLNALERAVHGAFTRDSTCDGREWWRTSTEEAVAVIDRLVGSGSLTQWADDPRPYDDWRDYSRPKRSHTLRRLWLGEERGTGRVKIIHSPHVDKFQTFCPTYNSQNLRWRSAWIPREIGWEASPSLNAHDRKVVEVWTRLVETLGFGEHDPRVGWLQQGVQIDDVVARLSEEGLQAVDISTVLSLGGKKSFVEV